MSQAQTYASVSSLHPQRREHLAIQLTRAHTQSRGKHPIATHMDTCRFMSASSSAVLCDRKHLRQGSVCHVIKCDHGATNFYLENVTKNTLPRRSMSTEGVSPILLEHAPSLSFHFVFIELKTINGNNDHMFSCLSGSYIIYQNAETWKNKCGQ